MSSISVVPISGLYVVYGISDSFEREFLFVSKLKSVDFPVFGKPAKTICISAFFMVSCEDFFDFFCFSIDSFSFLYLVLKLARIDSPALCFGTCFNISLRHSNLSSSVSASR